MRDVGSASLDPSLSQTRILHFRHTKIEAKDGWIQIGLEGDEYEFFDIVKSDYTVSSNIGNTLLTIEFTLSASTREVRRTIYDLLSVMADLGGVQDLLISMLGVFLFSMTEQSYYLKFIKHLFHLTRENDAKAKKNVNGLSADLKRVKLRAGDEIKLWASNYFGGWLCKCCWSKQALVTEMYHEGREKVE